MKDFAAFIKANREKVYSSADKNTMRNDIGQTVISRDDSWTNEDEWDVYYKELTAYDDSPPRSLVR